MSTGIDISVANFEQVDADRVPLKTNSREGGGEKLCDDVVVITVACSLNSIWFSFTYVLRDCPVKLHVHYSTTVISLLYYCQLMFQTTNKYFRVLESKIPGDF